MHTAIERGAPAGKKFNSYVEYLAANGFIPVEDRKRAGHIRTLINEANHNTMLASREEGEDIIDFTYNLLRDIYEPR